MAQHSYAAAPLIMLREGGAWSCQVVPDGLLSGRLRVGLIDEAGVEYCAIYVNADLAFDLAADMQLEVSTYTLSSAQ
jgi:hypothetical protein